MDLTNVDDLKIALQLAGLKANKGLGQHFLVDRDSLDEVMAAGEVTEQDTVLEIGPGLGVMTLPLTRVAKRVVAVEMDQVLADLLQNNRPDNLEVWQDDIMKADLTSLPAGYKVVANIPYYLTSPIFRLLLESPNPPSQLSLLIQKEVAQRIVAAPGQMSVLALSVQYYGEPKLVSVVERHKFWPPPKVDSAVLQVRVYDRPVFPADRDRLFRLIKAGFGEKRKMLKNSLAGGFNLSIELAAQLVKEAKLRPNARMGKTLPNGSKTPIYLAWA
jgi:16S rRNA (adenine1518-N6/adenine1519-N6)-dimethyltransferase